MANENVSTLNVSVSNGALVSLSETLTPSTNFAVPADVTVSGGTKAYNNTTGNLILSNLSSEVVVDGEAEPILASIEVSNAITEYTAGDTFIKPTVTAYYNDSTSADVSDDAVFSNYDLNNVGEQYVTVTYRDQTESYIINVSPLISLVSIAVSGQTTEFKIDDIFAFDGTVTATFDDTHTEDVTSEATISTPDISTVGQKTVTVTYGGEETSYNIQVGGVWYVKGSINDWTVDSRYKMLDADGNKPVNVEHQYIITLNLAVGDTFKFHLVGTDTWLSYVNFEEGGAKANFENTSSDNNINTLVAGEYIFYLKEYSGYTQIFVTKKNIDAQTVNTFGIIKLENNVLTVNGTSFKLVGTTTGSDTAENSYKTISSFIDGDGYINICIGSAVFKCEDFDTASNFVLSTNEYLETLDGAIFNVIDGSDTFSITTTVTNGTASGDTNIYPGGTADITITPTPNVHRVLPA